MPRTHSNLHADQSRLATASHSPRIARRRFPTRWSSAQASVRWSSPRGTIAQSSVQLSESDRFWERQFVGCAHCCAALPGLKVVGSGHRPANRPPCRNVGAIWREPGLRRCNGSPDTTTKFRFPVPLTAERELSQQCLPRTDSTKSNLRLDVPRHLRHRHSDIALVSRRGNFASPVWL